MCIVDKIDIDSFCSMQV